MKYYKSIIFITLPERMNYIFHFSTDGFFSHSQDDPDTC